MTYQHHINAAGKKLGRISSEAAKVLLGKHSPQFENNKIADVQVIIENAAKLDISDRKNTGEVRKRYTGYPGGQRVESLSAFTERKGGKGVIELAVKRMLQSNRLRNGRLKNLIISEGPAK